MSGTGCSRHGVVHSDAACVAMLIAEAKAKGVQSIPEAISVMTGIPLHIHPWERTALALKDHDV